MPSQNSWGDGNPQASKIEQTSEDTGSIRRLAASVMFFRLFSACSKKFARAAMILVLKVRG